MPSAGQQMQMIRGDGTVMSLPGGRMALLESESGGVVVRGMVEGEAPGSDPALLAEGDRIVSMQGAQVTGVDALTAAYDAIPEGDEVVLGVVRGDDARTIRFARPVHAAPGQHMVVRSPSGGVGAWTNLAPPGGGPPRW